MFSLAFLFLLAFATHNAAAALVNATIDDQNFSLISYAPSNRWNHEPLLGWEDDFHNRSRSFTYSRAAIATFVFTGSAIWALGPYAPDQAQRRISLDGVDQGTYNALAPERSPSQPFWSKRGLVYTTHTLVITHDDPGQNAILALDAFIVEYDNAEDPFPYTTTTVTSYAPEITVATDYTGHIVTTVTEPSQGGTIAGNSNESLISSRKSYTAIIIGVIVPVVVALILCCLGFCMYRKRRARTRERRRDSFREKMFRRIGRQPIELNAAGAAPLSPMYRTRERPMSGFTYASTHYSTAEEYPTSPSPPSGHGGRYTPASPTPFAVAFGRESDDYARAGTNAPAPRDERQGTAAPHLSMSFPPDHRSNRPPTTENGGNARSAGGERLASTYDPTFSPPTEWDSTPTARNPDEPITAARSGASTDPHTVMRDDHALSRTRSPASTISAPSAYVTAESHLRQPSTVFSASESSVSHQHQPRSPLSPLPPAHQRPFSTTSTHAPLSRPGSILRRFSQALGRSFARSGEPDAESNRNSVNMRTTPRAGVVHDHTLSDEQNPGYFRGMNHFNLGIPLNYRPSASAASPADATRLSRQSQNLQGQTIADESSTGLRSMTRAANGRMDDLAFSSYTQPTRDRVLSTAAPTTTPEHRPDVDTDINNNNNPRQVDEEDEKEKIIEAFDGSTIEGSMRAWSVGHGTMASQGTFNSPLDADGNMDGSGLARSGSQPSSRRSRRSVSHERAGHLAIPPPSYSVWIPPDTKGQH